MVSITRRSSGIEAYDSSRLVTGVDFPDPLRRLIRRRCDSGLFASGRGWIVRERREQRCHWTEFTRRTVDLPPQGFKLHVSAALTSAVEMCDRVLPILDRRHANFKVIATLDDVAAMLNGKFGATQVGKFITVYPRPDETIQVATELDHVTRDLPGPRIPGERSLPDSRVHYRYGAFDQAWVQLRSGRTVPAMRDETQAVEPDMRGVPTDPAGDPFISSGIAADVEREDHLLNNRYLRVRSLHSSPKGSCSIALDLRSADAAMVVVKEALAWVMPDRRGMDARARLRNEANVLTVLRGEPFAPQIVDYWDDGWRACLAYEFVPGVDLKSTVAELAGRGMSLNDEVAWSIAREIAAIVDRLHARGIVFGDLKPDNIVRGEDGRLHLLDFELASVDGESVARGFGTVGYASPAQRRLDHPILRSDDHFSFGATLFSIATGVELSSLPDTPPARIVEVHAGDLSSRLSHLVRDCLNEGDRDVPPDVTLESRIDQLANTVEQDRMAPQPRFSPLGEAERIGLTIGRIARHIDGVAYCVSEHPIAPAVAMRDLYAGNSGIALFLVELYRATQRDEFLRLATAIGDWLSRDEGSVGRSESMPGLYFGEAGVGLLFAELYRATQDERYLTLAEDRARFVSARSSTSPDLMTGAAGTGLYLLQVHALTRNQDYLHLADRVARSLLASSDSSGWLWAMPPGFEGLSDNSYFGFAHGAAGIGYFLAKAASVTGDGAQSSAVARIANGLVEAAQSSLNDGTGLNWPDVPDGRPSNIYWCHGATGIGRFLLTAYDLLRDGSYLRAANRAADTVAIGGRWAGPTQCHGLSGSIEFLIDLYARTRSPKRLRQAHALGALLNSKFRVTDGADVRWQSELPQVITPDYMIGEAGVGMAFIRLADPAVPHILAVDGRERR